MKLRHYQQHGVADIISTPKLALFYSMGMGKTATVATAIQGLLVAGEVSKVLVLAPKRVALSVWPEEVATWAPGVTTSVVVGTAKQRAAALAAQADVYVTNFDNLVWLLAQSSKWTFDMMVVDEASALKHHNSERSRAARRISRVTPRWVNLTGTPAPNGVHDLWHQTLLLDNGDRLGARLGTFRDKWFSRVGPQEYNNWVPRKGAAEEITEAISDICFSLKSEDYIELPPVTHNTLWVEMSPGIKSRYKKLEEEFILALPDGDASAPNAAALSTKCRQFANGALYLDDTDREFNVVHNLKLDALAEVIEEAAGHSVLVFYVFESDRQRILKRFKKAQHIDDVDLADWSRGEVPLMLAHPASAGHGLNLQHGGHIACWFGVPWNLEHYQQANKRLHRSGQEERVILHHIMCRDTLDARVLKRLAEKADVQDAVLTGLAA